jgi:hypothetical protein
MSTPAAVVSRDKLEDLIEEQEFTVDEIARAGGVASNTVYARRTTPPKRKTSFDERLGDLYFVVHELRDAGLDAALVRGWLCSRSAHLNGQIPLDLVARNEFEEVRRAAHAYRDGVLASEYRRALGHRDNENPSDSSVRPISARVR